MKSVRELKEEQKRVTSEQRDADPNVVYLRVITPKNKEGEGYKVMCGITYLSARALRADAVRDAINIVNAIRPNSCIEWGEEA